MPFNEGHFGVEHYEGGLKHYMPNLKVRVTENMAELLQEELLIYLQTFYNFDYAWPDKGTYSIKIFPIFTDVLYENLNVSPFRIDPYSFNFNFTTETDKKGNEIESVYMQLPLIENLRADAKITYYFFWIPIVDDLWVQFTNVTANVQVQLKASSHGKLRPQLKRIKLSLGTSDIYSRNEFHQWFIRQFVYPMRGFLENAIILFGPNMFNNALPLWTDVYLQQQISNFPIAIAEVNKTASFQVNWRMT